MGCVGPLTFARKLLAWAAAVVILHGCVPSAASTLVGGGRVVCHSDPVQIPSTFPVIVGVEVQPTADGFVEMRTGRRWRFGDAGIRSLPQGDLESVAWEGRRTVVGESNRVTIWDADRAVSCAETTRPILSVGLQADSVLWTDWAENDQASAIYSATFSGQGCGGQRLLGSIVGRAQQFTQPTLLGSRSLAQRTSISGGSDLVEFQTDGGISSLSSLGRRARLCGSANSLLVATVQELLRFEGDGGSSLVATFPSPTEVSDCNGTTLALSIDAPDGSTIVEYATNGQETSRRQVTGPVGGVGLAQGGWVILNSLLRGWDGRLIETPEPVLLTDVWAHGGTFMASIGRGPVLQWRDSTWQPVVDPNEEHFREVSDGAGGTLQLFRRGDSYEVWERGTRVVTLPRSSFTGGERSLTPRLWAADSCSGDLLLGIEFDGNHALAFRRGGEWQIVRVPVGSYLSARVDDDQFTVVLDPRTVMRRGLGSEGSWEIEEVTLNLPAETWRALPVAGGVVVESEAGIEFRTQDSALPIAPAGARLLGVSDGWVFWTLNDGVSVTAVP